MTSLQFTIWFTELLLEVFGAWFACKRRLWVLFSLLAFSAAADVFNISLCLFGYIRLYSYTHWLQFGGKYLLLTLLACFICGHMVMDDDRRHVWFAALLLSVIGGIAVGFVQSKSPDLAHKVLDARVSANIFLAIVVWLAWATRKAMPAKPWNIISSAVLIALVSDGLMSALWHTWAGAPAWFWVGEVASYGLMLWACKADEIPAGEVRLGLGFRTSLR